MNNANTLALLPPYVKLIMVCGTWTETHLCSEIVHGLIPSEEIQKVMCDYHIISITPVDDMNIVIIFD